MCSSERIGSCRAGGGAPACDARGLLNTALVDDNPVLFIEHRNLYRAAAVVPKAPHYLPYGRAAVCRTGPDVTNVAFGITLPMALEAARHLSKAGIEATVIDPRTFKPFDYDSVMAAVERTGGRLVVCDVAYRTGGIAVWLVGELAVRLPGLVRAVELVTSPDGAVLAGLTPHYFPTPQRVAAAARAVTRG